MAKIEIDAQIVIDICEEFFKTIEDERQEYLSEFVIKEMSKRFGKANTREEAIKRAENVTIEHENYFDLKPSFRSQYSKIEKLHRLAKLSLALGNGKIWISENDIHSNFGET